MSLVIHLFYVLDRCIEKKTFFIHSFIGIVTREKMSSSTTQKFREFMAEPLGDKSIRDVPGIGDVLGTKLTEAGYGKVRDIVDNSDISFVDRFVSLQAYTLFGKYLLCNKDLEQFQEWIQTQCGANSHQAKSAATAFADWAEAFI